jgi:hypothetical protein
VVIGGGRKVDLQREVPGFKTAASSQHQRPLHRLGVSLVENFRSSFAREIDQNGIDGLLKALSDRNKQLAASSGNL